jgi:DHA1 family inner membrane transport protein
MALLSLAIGSFGIGMTEFVVMGLLPQISADLLPDAWASDSADAIARTGWLITLYALGVVVGAPTIAASVAKYPRHRVMLILAAALTAFNALTFVMPTFELVAVSRFLAGLRTARTSASVRSSRPTSSARASVRRAWRSF